VKYLRDARVWRDLRLRWPPGRWISHRRLTSQRRAPVRNRGRTLPFPRAAIAVALVSAGRGSVLGAQSTAPAPYRAPTIALVQPPAGGSVPRDKPVVMLRFARGEPTDPLDVRTFAVTVDGVDRTALFQVTADEAWGALAKPESGDSLIAIGTHAVVARVCSVRGACGETATPVLIVEAPTAGATPAPSRPKSTRARVIELVLDAVRKLITP
jgi:hypothetical protein